MKWWSPTWELSIKSLSYWNVFIKFSYLRQNFLLAMFDLMGRFLGGTGKGTFSTLVLKECSNKTTIFNQSGETIFAWYPHWPDYIYTHYRQFLFKILSTEKGRVHASSTKIIPPHLHFPKHSWISWSLNLFPCFNQPFCLKGRRDLLIELLSSRLPGDRTSPVGMIILEGCEQGWALGRYQISLDFTNDMFTLGTSEFKVKSFS